MNYKCLMLSAECPNSSFITQHSSFATGAVIRKNLEVLGYGA